MEAVTVNGNGNVYRIYDETRTIELSDGEEVPWQMLVETYLVNDGVVGAEGTEYSWEASMETLSKVGAFVQTAIDETHETQPIGADDFVAQLLRGDGAIGKAVGDADGVCVREVKEEGELFRLSFKPERGDLRHPEGVSKPAAVERTDKERPAGIGKRLKP